MFRNCSLSLFFVGEKNFFRHIMLRILVLPLKSSTIALVSVISVILAGPCHLGLSLGFLPRGAKSSYHTKWSNLKVGGMLFCQNCLYHLHFDHRQCFWQGIWSFAEVGIAWRKSILHSEAAEYPDSERMEAWVFLQTGARVAWWRW